MAHPVAVDPHDRRRSPSQRRTSPSHQLRRTPGEKQRPRNYKPPGQTVNTADSARTMSGALSTGLYVAAYDLDAELSAVADSFQTYIRVALLALALVGLVAWFAAGRLLRPIRLLRDAAAGSSTADLTQRIPVTGRDDVSELAAAINAMFDRLQDSSMSQRRLLNDVGHELKTPITIIRGHLELLDAHNVNDVEETRTLAIDELDRMSTLVISRCSPRPGRRTLSSLPRSTSNRSRKPSELRVPRWTRHVPGGSSPPSEWR